MDRRTFIHAFAGGLVIARSVAEAHWHIYEAIRDREPGRAANLMSEHLIHAEREQQAEESDQQGPA